MEKWDEVLTAYRVAKLGTVSAAAASLGTHRATVIRHIDNLEAELGTKLFLRHSRGYTATEAGEELLRVAATADEQFTQLAKRTMSGARQISGELIVTSVEFMAPFLLPTLGRFRERYPESTIRYLIGGELLNMEYGEAHVAIRSGPKPDFPDNVVQRFLTVRTGLYAHPDYIAKHGFPASPAEFANHAFVGPAGALSTFSFHNWMRQHVPTENIVLKSSDRGVERQAVLAGLGIGFFPESQAAQERLKEVVAPAEDWSIDFWLLTHVDQHRSAKVQAFLSLLKEDTRS